MKQFKCKYCDSVMNVTLLEYRSNRYCNDCFELRASENPAVSVEDFNKVYFAGIEIELDDKITTSNTRQ